MNLYLIRHGEKGESQKNDLGGLIDTGLGEVGQQQAAALANWLVEHIPTIDALYTSTLPRAQETAAHVASAYGCTALSDERIRAVGCNRQDHTPWPNHALPPKTFTDEPFRPLSSVDDQESWMHIRIRVGLFVEAMVERHLAQTILVVSHSGILRALFDHVLNLGARGTHDLFSDPTSISHFEYAPSSNGASWQLHYLNRIDHLIAPKE